MTKNTEIYYKMLLEQYKLYVEMTDRISQRRQSANNYFLSINVLLCSFFSYFISVNSLSIETIFQIFGVGAIFLSGIIICYIWYRLIRSYKDMNSGKFKVIHEMEKMLPYQPYEIEWKKLGEGKDETLYLPFTRMELKVPWVFGILYVVMIVILCVRDFCS